MLEDLVQMSISKCILSQSLQAASKEGGTPDETTTSELMKRTPSEFIDLTSDDEDEDEDEDDGGDGGDGGDDADDDDRNDDGEDDVASPLVDTRAEHHAAPFPSSTSSIFTPQIDPDPSLSSLPAPTQTKIRLKRQRQGGGVDLISQLLGESSKSKARKLDPVEIVAKGRDTEGNKGKEKGRGKGSKGKRRVTWKADHLLEQVRLFHKSEEEKMEEGNTLGLSHRDEGEMLRRKTELLEWYQPVLLVLPLALQQESQKQSAVQNGKPVMMQEGEEEEDDDDDDAAKDHSITFDSYSPLETEGVEPNRLWSKDQTGLLIETAEIAWPDILLENMKAIEFPDAVAESPDQLLRQDSHPRSLPPPLLPQAQPPPPPPPPEPKRSLSYEGRAWHDLEKERDRHPSQSHHLDRRHSTDASHINSSRRVSISERQEDGRYYDRERREGGKQSCSERARDRGREPIPERVQNEERVPIPERTRTRRQVSPFYEEDKVVEERYGRRRSERTSGDMKGWTERDRYEEEERWHLTEYEKRESWRYNEEREREWRYDRYRQWDGMEKDDDKQDPRYNGSRRNSTTITTRGSPGGKSNETFSTSRYEYESHVWSSSPRRISSSWTYDQQPRQTEYDEYSRATTTSSSSSYHRSTDYRSERKNSRYY